MEGDTSCSPRNIILVKKLKDPRKTIRPKELLLKKLRNKFVEAPGSS